MALESGTACTRPGALRYCCSRSASMVAADSTDGGGAGAAGAAAATGAAVGSPAGAAGAPGNPNAKPLAAGACGAVTPGASPKLKGAAAAGAAAACGGGAPKLNPGPGVALKMDEVADPKGVDPNGDAAAPAPAGAGVPNENMLDPTSSRL